MPVSERMFMLDVVGLLLTTLCVAVDKVVAVDDDDEKPALSSGTIRAATWKSSSLIWLVLTETLLKVYKL